MKKIYKNNKSGQILLLVILVASILVTVAISTSQLTTQETRVSKLEEDSKRAFAAAEAGLEAALRLPSGSVDIGTLLGEVSGLSGTAVVTTTQAPTFTVPALNKDKMFTFYLSSYTPIDPTDPDSTPDYGTAYAGTLSIDRIKPIGADYCDGDQKHAVELTFINATTTNNKITMRKLIDECDIFDGTADEVDYGTDINLAQASSHILIVRMLAPDTNFEEGQIKIVNGEDDNWSTQGKTIISTATTTTDVSKRIKLFQSYPQIPSDFFVTSF